MTQTRNAVIYVRTASVQSIGRDTRADLQENRCRDYADKHDIEVEAVFRDSGKSGCTLVRPGLSALRAFLDEKQIQIVIVDDWSRLSRNLVQFHQLILEFDQFSAKLLSLDVQNETDEKLLNDMNALISIVSHKVNGENGRIDGYFPYRHN